METHLAILVINHDIVWLDIPMHNTLTMTKVERLEKFKDIVTDIIVDEARVESAEVGVVDIFEDKTGRFALIIPNDIEKSDDIRSTRQILENLDFTLYLLLLDRLQDLNHTFLIVDHIDTLKDFGILSSAYMMPKLDSVASTTTQHLHHSPILRTTS
jgi:hypothetical protein